MRRLWAFPLVIILFCTLAGCTFTFGMTTTTASTAATSTAAMSESTTTSTKSTTTLVTTTTKATTATTVPDTVWEPVAEVREGALAECAANSKKYAENLYDKCDASSIGNVSDNSLFEEGNALYKSADYEGALECYYAFLEIYPAHIGALNNKGLALLQLEKNESALTNYMMLYELYPDYYQSFINLQVAAHACGYTVLDLSEYLESFMFNVMEGVMESEPGMTAVFGAYAYNLAYSAMEMNDESLESAEEVLEATQELFAIAQGTLTDTSDEVEDVLSALEQAFPGDTEIAALAAYYESLKEQKV